MKLSRVVELSLLAISIVVADATIALSQTSGPTVDARQFSVRPHAGTLRDPWPGTAITKAINSLPSSGGTVSIADGIWRFANGVQQVHRGNFTLQGQSLNAQLYFATGELAIGAYGDIGSAISNVTISGLTIDASHLPQTALEPAVQVWQCSGCQLTSSVIYGHANGSLAAFQSFGGADWQYLNNKFISLLAGGAQLQINALGDSSNTGFLVENNEFDSVNILTIGVNNLHITNNYMHNTTLGNFFAIFFAPSYQGTSSNLVIDYNTLDAAIGGNGGIISGLPQDPGGAGSMSDIKIDHNTLRSFNGTIIAANSYDGDTLLTSSDLSQITNIQITNNYLDAQAGDSEINVSGGNTGSVNGGIVSGNTLVVEAAGAPNLIIEDSHTYNVTILGNSGI